MIFLDGLLSLNMSKDQAKYYMLLDDVWICFTPTLYTTFAMNAEIVIVERDGVYTLTKDRGGYPIFTNVGDKIPPDVMVEIKLRALPQH